MTVSSSASRNQYTATAGQTVFAYTFEIVSDDDIVVLKNGVTLTKTTNYTVSGVGSDSGGNVTLVVGATAGDILTLYRDMPYERLTDYTNAGDFLAADVNNDFDRLWIATQQVNEEVNRSLKVPVTDPLTSNMTLPAKADRLNKILRFNVTTGDPEVITLASGATSAANVSFTQAGTGAVETTVDAKLNGLISVKDFGAVGDGTTDDTAAIQKALNRAVSLGEENEIVFDGIFRITDTVSLTIAANQSIPAIKCTGYILYDGTNDRPAVSIGTAGYVLFRPKIELSVVNNNQSDWTNTSCIGVRLINLNSGSNINIKQVNGFTIGLQCMGDGAGFVYNNLTLGYMYRNGIGYQGYATNSGWCNENVIIGGRFGVATGINSAKERVAVQLKDNSSNRLNNNLFVKPSFELNNTDAPNLGVGFDCIGATQNHVFSCRIESTYTSARFDSDSGTNIVEIGYSDSGLVVSDSGYADNVVTGGNVKNQQHLNVVFDAPDMVSRMGLDAGSLARFSGMVSCNGSTGVIGNYISSVTNETTYFSCSSSTRYIGVIVDTSVNKNFTLSINSETGNGGRFGVACFDSGGSLLTGSSPNYATGTSNAGLTFSGSVYKTGADSTLSRSVRFHDDVKTAFIGVTAGTSNLEINSFRLYASDSLTGVVTSGVVGNELTSGNSPFIRFAASIPVAGTWARGDILFDSSPSAGGTIGWVCVTAGTPGTWKSFGAISA